MVRKYKDILSALETSIALTIRRYTNVLFTLLYVLSVPAECRRVVDVWDHDWRLYSEFYFKKLYTRGEKNVFKMC